MKLLLMLLKAIFHSKGSFYWQLNGSSLKENNFRCRYFKPLQLPCFQLELYCFLKEKNTLVVKNCQLPLGYQNITVEDNCKKSLFYLQMKLKHSFYLKLSRSYPWQLFIAFLFEFHSLSSFRFAAIETSPLTIMSSVLHMLHQNVLASSR